MILLELLGSLLDELVPRNDRLTEPTCRCTIDHHLSSGQQAIFVILRAGALLPSDTAHVAELRTTQASGKVSRWMANVAYI